MSFALFPTVRYTHCMPKKQQKPTGEQRDPDARFGRRIAELRHARGLTQEELAKLSGVSQSYIAELEHGRRLVPAMRLSMAAALAKALRVEIGGLLEEPESDERPGRGRPAQERLT